MVFCVDLEQHGQWLKSTVIIPAASQATALPENVGSSASWKSLAVLLIYKVKYYPQVGFAHLYYFLINSSFSRVNRGKSRTLSRTLMH